MIFRKAYPLILSVIFCINCNTDQKELFTDYTIVPEYDDVLTLDLTLGGETDVDDEFLLVKPKVVAANSDDDIYVLDEWSTKIFYKSGKGKKVFGGRGEAPGEFGQYPIIYLSPTDYLTVADVYGYKVKGAGKLTKLDYTGWSRPKSSYYTVFTPQSDFVKKEFFNSNERLAALIKENKWENADVQIGRTYFLNDVEMVMELKVIQTVDNKYYVYQTLLLYDSGEQLHQIVNIEEHDLSDKYSPVNTNFLWDVTQNKEIIYVINEELLNKVKPGNNNPLELTLHEVTLSSMEQKGYSIPVMLFPISESLKNEFSKLMKKQLAIIDTPKMKMELNTKKRFLERRKYYSPVIDIKIDRHFAFIFYNVSEIDLNDPAAYEEAGCVCKIMDLNSGKTSAAFKLPFYPSYIRNGYAYIIEMDENGFRVVKRYVIDPKVYEVK